MIENDCYACGERAFSPRIDPKGRRYCTGCQWDLRHKLDAMDARSREIKRIRQWLRRLFGMIK